MVLKVAIVGCGKIADGHVEELQKLPELARVVAVCDREPLMAEQLALRYGIPHHTGSFERLLAEQRPDVVHIATPPAAHLPLARQALEAGCHLFVEKPIAPSYAEAQELVALVCAAGKQMTVGHGYFFDPPALAMRELIGAGAIGEPLHVESHYGYALAGPFGSALLRDGEHWVHRLPGKLLQNNIDHLLNKLGEFVRDERPQVRAFGTVLREERCGDGRDSFPDEVRFMLQGERVSAFGTFSSHARPIGHTCRVHGTKNTLLVDYAARTLTLGSTGSLPSALGRLLPAWQQALQFARQGARNVLAFAAADFHFFAGLRELLKRFYGSILEGTPPPLAYRDLLWTARTADEIYAQLAGAPAIAARASREIRPGAAA